MTSLFCNVSSSDQGIPKSLTKPILYKHCIMWGMGSILLEKKFFSSSNKFPSQWFSKKLCKKGSIIFSNRFEYISPVKFSSMNIESLILSPKISAHTLIFRFLHEKRVDWHCLNIDHYIY